MNESLGPCCICETTEGVRNILMLNKKCLVCGHGWGCVVCGLPSDGASAVLCDKCLILYHNEPKGALKFACRGYPAIEGLISIDQLQGYHEHDYSKHNVDD